MAAFPGLFASRCNYDVVTGADGVGKHHSGVLEQSWRAGGASGAEIAEHKHNCEESVMVLEGEAIAVIDGVEHRLGPFDTTWIPADLPHFFRNASASEQMRIFWTYASIDATRTIVATGDTRTIDAERAA